jgi:flagellar M-ring protein FliF
MDWLKQDFHNILQTAILGIVAILAILLVIRPLVNRAIETTTFSEDEAMDEEALLPGGALAKQLTDQRGEGGLEGMMGEGEDEDDSVVSIGGIDGGIKSSSLRRITKLIDSHPEESLAVLRGWMAADKGF